MTTGTPYGPLYNRPDEDLDEPQDTLVSVRRPRRRFWNARTGVLVAVLVGAVCFYAGVRVEKGQLSNSSSATASGSARAFSATARGGASTPGRGGALTAGGNATFGTVSSLNGNNLYISDASGNTVKVTVTSSTALTKSQTVGKSAIRPGDTVVVQGVRNASGALVAASVSDSGTRGSGGAGAFGLLGRGSAGGGSGSAGGSGGASSAVNSLFGKGG